MKTDVFTRLLNQDLLGGKRMESRETVERGEKRPQHHASVSRPPDISHKISKKQQTPPWWWGSASAGPP